MIGPGFEHAVTYSFCVGAAMFCAATMQHRSEQARPGRHLASERSRVSQARTRKFREMTMESGSARPKEIAAV